MVPLRAGGDVLSDVSLLPAPPESLAHAPNYIIAGMPGQGLTAFMSSAFSVDTTRSKE
jgi:hypothetical protein